MKFKVYHAIRPTFIVPHSPIENCEHVATVEAERLEDVYHMTNHIDKPWWENEGIYWYKPACRSTSVGDLVVDENGKKFRCEFVGWKEET